MKKEAKLPFNKVDVGYGFVKYVLNGEVHKVRAVVGILGDAIEKGKKVDILTIDNVSYVVGDDVYKLGCKPIVANENTHRAQSEAYRVLSIYALAKAYEGLDSFNVITGLPYQNLDESQEVKDVFTGDHKISLNGKEIEFSVKETVVVSQGLGTYYMLVKQRGTGVFQKKILIVDIGFRTINYLPINNGQIDASTVKTARELGIQDAYIEIANAINLEFKTDYKYYDVDTLLDNGVPQQDKEKGKYHEAIHEKDYVKRVLESYAKDVWDDLISRYTGEYLDTVDEIVFGGGSSIRVQEQLSEYRKHYCTFMEDSQDAQVLGYEEIASKL